MKRLHARESHSTRIIHISARRRKKSSRKINNTVLIDSHSTARVRSQ